MMKLNFSKSDWGSLKKAELSLRHCPHDKLGSPHCLTQSRIEYEEDYRGRILGFSHNDRDQLATS